MNRPRLTMTARRLANIVAVDGEGTGVDASGGQRYTLLAASTGDQVARHQLSSRDCFEFLLSLPSDALLVGYSLGYDVNQWLVDLPVDKLDKLWTTGRVSWDGYALVWHPGKMFAIGTHRRPRMVRKRSGDFVRRVCYDRHRTIWDTFGYHQHSFVTALHEWDIGTPEQRALIESMKAVRGEFTDEQSGEIAAYCHDECRLTVEMTRRVFANTTALGLKLARYDGAGSIAAAMFRKHRVKQYIDVPPRAVHEAAMHAYFGGRFETAEIGELGSGHAYDINSAYPTVTAELPCLRCGTWREMHPGEPLQRWAFYHVAWEISPLIRWGPFPYRTQNGGIVYPHAGEGIYGGSEVETARALYGERIRIVRGFVYNQRCGHQPFRFVPEYYDRRKELKASGDFGHIILKLGLNSLYGKTAQSVGGKKRPDGSFDRPAYQSFVWAAWITGETRATILRAINAGSSDNVLSIATDGIITRELIQGLRVGSELGDWTREDIDDLSLVQNGVYRYRNAAGDWKQRARGFPGREFDFPRLLSQFERDRLNTTVRTHETMSVQCQTCRAAGHPCATLRFVGAGAALQRVPKLTNWRAWIRVGKQIRLIPPNRLDPSVVGRPVPTSGPIETFAWLNMHGMSTPYRPPVSFADLFRDDESGELSPEWDDGPSGASNAIAAAIRSE